MSSTDKTGEKLLASIRKTRSSGDASQGTDDTGNVSASATPATTAKRAASSKRKTAPGSRAKKTAVKPAASPAPKRAASPRDADASADPYQTGRRIWPD
jgi:hypothetical protein